ncbi:MAG TPA: hypothetical protein VLH77_00555, partial [Gammaproteobacteria bacterium]|nr:hypothetical protein [Gammaproteobacteria bacterium]
MNNSGLLTYLIQELKGREINPTQEAAVFILISLIIYYYPPIINHPQRQKLEQLYDYCFSMCSSQELFTILEKPENAQVKILLSQYLKQLLGAKPSNKKNTSPKNHLLDSYTG